MLVVQCRETTGDGGCSSPAPTGDKHAHIELDPLGKQQQQQQPVAARVECRRSQRNCVAHRVFVLLMPLWVVRGAVVHRQLLSRLDATQSKEEDGWWLPRQHHFHHTAGTQAGRQVGGQAGGRGGRKAGRWRAGRQAGGRAQLAGHGSAARKLDMQNFLACRQPRATAAGLGWAGLGCTTAHAHATHTNLKPNPTTHHRFGPRALAPLDECPDVRQLPSRVFLGHKHEVI